MGRRYGVQDHPDRCADQQDQQWFQRIHPLVLKSDAWLTTVWGVAPASLLPEAQTLVVSLPLKQIGIFPAFAWTSAVLNAGSSGWVHVCAAVPAAYCRDLDPCTACARQLWR